MPLGRNLAAGLASSIWIAIIGLAVVPLYLKYLGVEAYGLIGFFATTQALLQLLDLGLAQTMNREISRYSTQAKWGEVRNLLHTLAVIYWIVALLIAAVVFALAPWIASHWVKAEQLSPATLERAVQLMGVVIACRWPVGLYQGALNGLERITTTSAINAVMMTLSSVGAVFVLAFVSATIEAFFIWQACVGITSAVTMRLFAWRAIQSPGASRFDIVELRRIWRFATGVGVIALSGVVLTQLDKLLLSKILNLTDFGHYMLATVIANGLYLLINPLFNVIYPRFSSLVATGKDADLRMLYRLGTRMFVTMLFPVALIVAVFARELVFVWTRDEAIAQSVAPMLTLLSLGTALHGVMYFPYALQLAYGLPRLPLKINLLLLCLLVPLTIFLASHFGAMGGALAWFLLHLVYVLLGSWLTHRELLVGIGGQWLLRDIAVPLISSSAVFLAVYSAVARIKPSVEVSLVFALSAALLSILTSVAMSPQSYKLVVDVLGFRKRVA